MTIKTHITRATTGLWAIWFELPYPCATNIIPFAGGYLSETAAHLAAENIAAAIGRSIEVV